MGGDIASSRGDDARGAYVAAATHSDAQAPDFLKNGAFRLRGGVGILCFRTFPVFLFRILKSSLDTHRGLNTGA